MALEIETVRSNSRHCPQSEIGVIQKWFMYELISEAGARRPRKCRSGDESDAAKLSRFEYFFFHHLNPVIPAYFLTNCSTDNFNMMRTK